MTNGWTDIANADVIVAMGGNPAENHPVGFRFVMEAKRKRNAKLVASTSASSARRPSPTTSSRSARAPTSPS
jgi:anaerobic selenocysteine-containing dehydrogenase